MNPWRVEYHLKRVYCTVRCGGEKTSGLLSLSDETTTTDVTFARSNELDQTYLSETPAPLP